MEVSFALFHITRCQVHAFVFARHVRHAVTFASYRKYFAVMRPQLVSRRTFLQFLIIPEEGVYSQYTHILCMNFLGQNSSIHTSPLHCSLHFFLALFPARATPFNI